MDGASETNWRLLGNVLWSQRRGLGLAVAVGIGWTVGKLAVPRLIQLAIDRGIDGDGALWFWSGLIVVAGLVAGTFTAFRRYLAFREARWTETKFRERLFDHIMSLHVGYHDRSQTGQLMSRASSDLNMVQMFVTMVPITIANFMLLAGAGVILFVTDPWLALVALAPLPFVNVTAARFSRRIHPVVRQVQAEQAELATVVEESVAGVRVVKGFGAEHVQIAKLEKEAEDIRVSSLGAARIRAVYMPAMEVLPQLGLIAVLGVGGHRVLNGVMTIGELVAFNTYVALLVIPLRMMGMTVAWGQRAGAALQRVDEVLSTVPEVADPADPVLLPSASLADRTGAQRELGETSASGSVADLELGEPPKGTGGGELGRRGEQHACEPSARGSVEFEHVTFGYDASAPVLRDFTLNIPAGQSMALVGGTASGKSTVARLLVRFYEPQNGVVRLDGIDIRDLTLHELRRAVGIVFEDTLLFHDTVAANIAFACPDADSPQIERASRLAGAHDFITALPDGYGTLLGERGFSLSGGQRQRIAIARAILADPRVLVLDDATSAVDPSKEHEIREAMRTVMDGRTTLVIAHRPGTIALADVVVLLDGGRVAATGTHDQLVATNARYRSVLASMSELDDARRAELHEQLAADPDLAAGEPAVAGGGGGGD